MSERVFSGIQPSGDIHIGNYLGAIKNWVSLSDKYECLYCIVDYHALTVKFNPEDMKIRVWNAILDNIACGIDPQKSKIFIQSHVPEHTELAWILNTVTSMGDLERMTQYKDKSRSQKDNINSGLFTYPVLQTADILLYKATLVPVGDDQIQHIELAREITRAFNSRYGEIFPEPKELVTKISRIMGLDGKSKMSKSLNNYIGLNEDQETIRKKIMSAITDENRKRRNDPGDPSICNIFSLHSHFTNPDQINQIEKQCKTAEIGCVDCKKILIEGMWKELQPIQQKRMSLDSKLQDIKEIIYENGKYCKQIAQETMATVKNSLGLL